MHGKQSHRKSSEQKMPVRQNEILEKCSKCETHGPKGLADSLLPSCISRQPYMSGASTVHATNYDSWRENEREEKCSTNTETH